MRSQERPLLVFGAGCIGRGLLGDLAARQQMPLVFVEAQANFAEQLKKAGAYTIRLVGRSEESARVENFEVLHVEEKGAIAERIRDCALIATAVGGEHLESAARIMAPGLAGRDEPVTILVCENMSGAGSFLEDALLRAGARREDFDCQPVSVERMVRPLADSLDLLGESCKSGYVAYAARADRRCPLAGLVVCEDLQPYYARKLFTNNAGHALLAYEGHLAGCNLLCDALDDPLIHGRLKALLQTSVTMLSREFDLDQEALEAHVENLLRWRFANRDLADTVGRVARDPLRKLGPHERLVGLLRLLEKHHLPIGPVCRVIAAALFYEDAADAAACRMRERIAADGPEAILLDTCMIQADEEAFGQILENWQAIKKQERT